MDLATGEQAQESHADQRSLTSRGTTGRRVVVLDNDADLDPVNNAVPGAVSGNVVQAGTIIGAGHGPYHPPRCGKQVRPEHGCVPLCAMWIRRVDFPAELI